MAAEPGTSAVADPTFWVAVAFFVFLGLLFFMKVHKQIASALDARADRIAKQLDEARNLRDEAQSDLAQRQRRQREADSEAEAIVSQAEEDARAMMREAEEKLETLAQRREKAAEDKIAQAEANAVKQVRAAAAAVAVQAARQVLAEQMTGKRGDKAIGDAIDQMGAKLGR